MAFDYDINGLMERLKSESVEDAQIRAALNRISIEPFDEDEFPGEPYSRSDYEDEYDE